MRARNLKPGFFGNEKLGSLPFEDRILFEGLWCLSDREGFFENRPDRISALIFPYDKKIDGKRITVMLQRLMSRQVITLIDTHGYLPTFLDHNNPHPHEAKCTVPEEIKNILKKLCNDMSLTCKLQAGLNPESCILNPESLLLNPESKNSLRVPENGTRLSLSFEELWKIYPKHREKGTALEAFKKLNPNPELIASMKSAIEKQIEHKKKCDKENKFCPEFKDFHRWFKKRCWEDELEAAPSPTLNFPSAAECRSLCEKGVGNYLVCKKNDCVHAHQQVCPIKQIELEVFHGDKNA
jgi:hypothetical protein